MLHVADDPWLRRETLRIKVNSVEQFTDARLMGTWR